MIEPLDDEEDLLRSVALQNAQSILLARQRAGEDLVRAKEALEVKTQELAHSLAMLRATLESTTDGILVTEGSGRVTSFNENLVKMWRIPPEVMDSREHRRLLEFTSRYFAHPAQFLAKVDEIYASSPAESYDLLELADGRAFERFSRIQFVDDRNVGRVWSFRDVSERKRAEETSRFLADASGTLVELTNHESTLKRVAQLAVPAFADWCTVDLEEHDGSVRRLAVAHSQPAMVQLGHELFRTYPPRPGHSHGVMKVLRTGEPELIAVIPNSWFVEATHDEEHLRIVRGLGLKSYICVPLRSRTRTHGALTFVTAESGRVYDSADLAAAQDLAHRAVIAIENASLLVALKESDRRKDEFLAMLAHELRNPLAPIRYGVQIIRGQGPSASESQWATDVIDRQVHQLERLVDDLLDVSRITTGNIELRKERVELAAIVNSAVEASRPIIEKWGHELTVTLPPQPIHLEADLTRLAQVLLNLLNNAAKYTDHGGRIWVTAECEDDQARIRVTDTGIGIPAEMLSSIFEMFTQVDHSLERSEGGLGIGLTLVRRLVEMHGGTVEARSHGPCKGSEFVVRLPLAGKVRGKARKGAAGQDQGAVASVPRRILVVDDNRDAADSLGMLLRLMGNEVHTAHDGLDAVGATAAFQPDIVFLDIGLPKLNGYDVARRIREEPGNSGIVLVALTGWGQEEDRRRSREAGFDHHMTKPINFAAVQKLLAEGTGAG